MIIAFIRGVFQPLAVFSHYNLHPQPLSTLGTAMPSPSAGCCADMDGKAASHLLQIIFVIADIKPWDTGG